MTTKTANNARRKMWADNAVSILYLVFIVTIIAEYVTRTGAYVDYNHALYVTGWVLTPFVVICAGHSYYRAYKNRKLKKAKK